MPQEGERDTELVPTVFIVDDEPAMRDCLRLLVQTMGLAAKCFSSAGEFLEYITPMEISQPVCLIADVQMPRISGIELLKRLRSSGRKFPVVMTSGHRTVALEHNLEAMGATYFLEKPFRPNELQEIVAKSIKRMTSERSATN